jgi:Ca2+-binding EF-hand superfamily protein
MGGLCQPISLDLNPNSLELFHNALLLDDYQISLLHKNFRAMTCEEKLVDRKMFFAYIHEEDSTLSREIFRAIDIVGSGKLNFLDFVCSVWNFLTLDPSELGSYAFRMFSLNDTEIISFDQLKSCAELFGRRNFTDAEIKRMIGKDELDLVTFVSIMKLHPDLLTPLISFQNKMQGEICGRSFWLPLIVSRHEDPNRSRHNYVAEILLDHNETISKNVISRPQKKTHLIASDTMTNNVQSSHMHSEAHAHHHHSHSSPTLHGHGHDGRGGHHRHRHSHNEYGHERKHGHEDRLGPHVTGKHPHKLINGQNLGLVSRHQSQKAHSSSNLRKANTELHGRDHLPDNRSHNQSNSDMHGQIKKVSASHSPVDISLSDSHNHLSRGRPTAASFLGKTDVSAINDDEDENENENEKLTECTSHQQQRNNHPHSHSHTFVSSTVSGGLILDGNHQPMIPYHTSSVTNTNHHALSSKYPSHFNDQHIQDVQNLALKYRPKDHSQAHLSQDIHMQRHVEAMDKPLLEAYQAASRMDTNKELPSSLRPHAQHQTSSRVQHSEFTGAIEKYILS